MVSIKSGADASPSNNKSILMTPLRWITGARQWRWVAAAFALFAGISLVSVLFGAAVTPSQDLNMLGQHFTVRAASPTWSLCGHGKITVNTGTPQTYDLLPTDYCGPLRVHLTVDAPFQGSDLLNQAAMQHKLPPAVVGQVMASFEAWLITFGLIALGTALLLSTAAAFLVMILKNGSRRQACLLIARSFVAATLSVIVAAAVFVAGSMSIANASSLDELVGHSTLHLSPKPMGPKFTGYDAVSIGDSRAATQGGKGLQNPSYEDKHCRRSSDSLAAQIGRLKDWRVLNLACSSATIKEGLMGEQTRGGRKLIPQVSAVKQMTNIKAVFVTIGPNDLWWSRVIGLCYLADTCNDNLTTPDYGALMEEFKWNYHDLLQELQSLHNGPGGTHPMVIINGSYGVFGANTNCADTKGLSDGKIEMLSKRNGELNDALKKGAELFGFTFVPLSLEPLCADLSAAPGPEIRGPRENDAFHPTSLGVLRIATDDAAAAKPAKG